MGRQFLGMGKTKYNSSICLIDESDLISPIKLLLTERLTRRKNSGAWPESALGLITSDLRLQELKIAENRDVMTPRQVEDLQDLQFPFYDYLKKKNLDIFTGHFNPHIKNLPHHLCHAYAALAMSPFEKSVIIVMDGAGSELGPNSFEECSVYLQDGVTLVEVFKQEINFKISEKFSTHVFGNRIGASYEKASEFIFNSPHSSGKVMGLAPFGKALKYDGHYEFQQNLEWDSSFKDKSKKEWESRDHTLFKNIAATVQGELENSYQQIINFIKSKHPEYENLVLTGGCALNCTNNAKIYYEGLFKKIFVPPFPGDECIGFGAAHFLKFTESPESWSPVSFEKQGAYFGAVIPDSTHMLIDKEFDLDLFEVQECKNIVEVASKLLQEKNIIAWFQGRSESGPRALGNRSILAHPDTAGLKDKLNSKIKFRESFRPYGCSVLYEKSHLYFDVEEGFENPYMSYAIQVLEPYRDKLKEVSHVDNSSRMQTVRVGQNELFYKLIEDFGNNTNLYCLLNTSLNVMDEPMVETIDDMKRFMEQTALDYFIINNFLFKRKVSLM